MTLLQKKIKLEIKTMIENLLDELYQLENKEAKCAKLRANIRWELEGKKCFKMFFKVLEKQNLQNQTISELYTDDNKSKYSSNPKDIFKSEKKIMKIDTLRRQLPKLLILNLLAKFLTEKKYLMNN